MTKLASERVDNRSFAPREIENNAIAKFCRENKEYYVIFEKGLWPCELPQASPWINLNVPGKKHTNSQNLLVDNKSEEGYGKLALKNC